MPIVPIVIVILGGGIGILSFFVIKSLFGPRQISAVMQLVKQGKTQAAAKACRAMIARDPRHAEAHYYLGLCLLAESKPELALMEFKTVNQIGRFGPEVPEIEFRSRISELYERFGQLEEALKEQLLLTKLDPDKSKHYYECGRLFAARSRGDMAMNYLRKAIELDPRNGKAHYELGILLYKEKKSLEAKEAIETALRCDPSNIQAFYYLGKLMKDARDFTGALLAFEKAQREPEFKVKALVERGGCYMSMNSYDKAIAELERAVKSAQDDSSSEALYGRYFLAMCYEKNRDLDRAIEQWEKIYAKKPGFRDVAEKLSHYQEFRTDDKMKDYLTCAKPEFIELCKSVTSNGMSFTVRDVTEIQDGVDIIAVENDSAKWRNTRKLPRLIRFLRVPDLIDEGKLRELLEAMKKLNVVRGVIITSSAFTRAAQEYAESRPLELYNKDKLQELLVKSPLGGDQAGRA
jgi:tetratricopeptide (TPR) repeat protein